MCTPDDFECIVSSVSIFITPPGGGHYNASVRLSVYLSETSRQNMKKAEVSRRQNSQRILLCHSLSILSKGYIFQIIYHLLSLRYEPFSLFLTACT